jgi:hypothetical membrane protein
MSGSASLQAEPAQSRWLVLPAVCGMLAPLVYSGSALVASRTYPGFSHRTTFISELGATGAPSAHLMNYGGFLPYGVLIIAFALALHRTVRSAAGGWLGPMLLGVYGLAYVALAFATCDYGCAAAAPSLAHRIHFLLGDLIVIAAVAAPVALYPRMLNDPAWSSLARATLVLPALAWLVFSLAIVGLPGGVRQRVWLLLLFIWIELVSVRLLRTRGRAGTR